MAFDMGRTIQLDLNLDAAIAQRIRWRLQMSPWRASAARSREKLRRARVPARAYNRCGGTMARCWACRVRAQPGSQSATATLGLASAFHAAVQWDILFCETLLISQLRDDVARLCEASTLAD
eukprot:8972496-Pyramimonas_sp.AAC.1